MRDKKTLGTVQRDEVFLGCFAFAYWRFVKEILGDVKFSDFKLLFVWDHRWNLNFRESWNVQPLLKVSTVTSFSSFIRFLSFSWSNWLVSWLHLVLSLVSFYYSSLHLLPKNRKSSSEVPCGNVNHSTWTKRWKAKKVGKLRGLEARIIKCFMLKKKTGTCLWCT